jgi:hypothetical protein
MRVGEPVEIRWHSTGSRTANCRSPLYLVFTTSARVRFEGEGFLAMPPGAAGPYSIGQSQDQTRVFIPLHGLPETASGTFKVKFYSSGANTVSWFVAGLVPSSDKPARRTAKVLAAADEPLTMTVATGKPAIVIRDAFAPDVSTAGVGIEIPKKRVVSNSNAFELQVFEKFYRVLDVKTGEIVIERVGVNPNFSPSSRFLGAFAEGIGFEIVDLYADSLVVASAPLNRNGGYEGTAHLAAWSYNDAIVALSFWGWGGVYVKQNLIDGPGVGDGAASCHACQGIGTALFVNIDTGIVSWSGQQQGWGSLFHSDLGSRQAHAQAEQQLPNPNEDSTIWERQQALEKRLSQTALTALGERYLFEGRTFLARLPKDDATMNYDGSAWHLGGALQLSHACTQDAADNCSSLGEESDEGRATLKALAAKRIEHHGRTIAKGDTIQAADERLMSARAASSSRNAGPGGKRGQTIWDRLDQLGVSLAETRRMDVAVDSFNLEETLDNPRLVYDKVLAKLPAMRNMLVEPSPNGTTQELLEKPDAIKTLNSQKVTSLAQWKLNGVDYLLAQQNYQMNNSSTPNAQYLHLISSAASGINVVDLSSRLYEDGTVAKATDQSDLQDHPWPSDFDLVTIAAERYLLASGHWLHDSERWALVYDLKENKTLFFDGDLPSAEATSALAITDNRKILLVANRDGQVYFYNISSGKRVLAANYVDDELIVYDSRGYYMSTYEGSQFVFLKFPGQPGYLSFRQFARTLNRPDLIKAILDGRDVDEQPALSPPPRLEVALHAEKAQPGAFTLAASATSAGDLERVRLFVDGQLWSERGVSGKEARLGEHLMLPAQARWLTAVAVDSRGNESAPVAREIARDKRQSERRLFLLAMGTDNYSQLPADMQLRYAVSDAKHFVSAVQQQKSGYYKSVETTSFLNKSGLKTALPQALRAIAQSATADDTIMLFVSSHAYRADDGRLYLLLNESALDNLEGSSLSWEELARSFEGVKARIIVFIDACHSGAVPNGGSNDEVADTLAAQQLRFTVMAAAKGRQESFEKDDIGGGVFTTALVSAITKDRATLDSNNNGVVELTELYGKVKPAVLTQMRGVQTPWLARADMVGEVPLF